MYNSPLNSKMYKQTVRYPKEKYLLIKSNMLEYELEENINMHW
jgi:hypothetical protein